MTKKNSRNFINDISLYFIEIFEVFIFVALATIVTLTSCCPYDLSFNMVIDWEASNLLSFVRSYYHDVMMQIFDTYSYVVSIIILSFGYQLLKYHIVSFLRIISSIISSISFSIILTICGFKVVAVKIIGSFIVKFIEAK